MSHAIEIRVSNYKDKDKPAWPELEGKPIEHHIPTKATLLEKGTSGGKATIIFSAERENGSVVAFELTQNLWDMLNGAFTANINRWGWESKPKCNGKFIRIDSLASAKKMNLFPGEWESYHEIFIKAGIIYRCESCGGIGLVHMYVWDMDIKKDPDIGEHFKRESKTGGEYVSQVPPHPDTPYEPPVRNRII